MTDDLTLTEAQVHAIDRTTGDHLCDAPAGLGTDALNPAMVVTCPGCLRVARMMQAARVQGALAIAHALIPLTRSPVLDGESPLIRRGDASRALGAALRAIDVGAPAWRQWKDAEHSAGLWKDTP